MRRSTVLSLPPQLVFPAFVIKRCLEYRPLISQMLIFDSFEFSILSQISKAVARNTN
jgi:hypothetical protein